MNLLLLALLTSAPAQVECDQVRATRALALKHRLDDASLRALESLYCSAQARSSGCEELLIMSLLSRAANRTREPVVNEHRAQVCKLGSAFPQRWPNGLSAARGATRTWPSGVRARDAQGTWFYPTGVRAGSLATSLYWPSGVRAFDGKAWYQPSGVRAPSEVEVVNAACKKRDCRRELDRIRDAQGELRAFLLIALATGR